MLKQFFVILMLILLLGACGTQKQTLPPAERTALGQEANGVIKKFKNELKFILKKAVKSGGFVEAINVCSIQAPKLAEKLSEETGWKIKRVSLKRRNHRTAVPDSWEREVLKQFDERRARGEAASKIQFSENVGNNFRFMKAQGVQPLCLKCHGKTLDASVDKALKKYYPEDKAKGYSLGEIRGAFSLIKKK